MEQAVVESRTIHVAGTNRMAWAGLWPINAEMGFVSRLLGEFSLVSFLEGLGSSDEDGDEGPRMAIPADDGEWRRRRLSDALSLAFGEGAG